MHIPDVTRYILSIVITGLYEESDTCTYTYLRNVTQSNQKTKKEKENGKERA